MKKKKMVIIIASAVLILLAFWAAMFITDFRQTTSLKMPVFARGVDTADDGGSGTYKGLGYKIEVECYLDAEYGLTVTETTMTVCGKVVAASISDFAAGNESDTVSDTSLPYDWGISLSVEDVTANGLILCVTQSEVDVDGELQTGSGYVLERKREDKWEKAKFAIEGDIAWDTVAYIIKENGQTEFEIVWSNLYGELNPGEYRIQKDIQLYRAPGDYDTDTYYAEFTVTKGQTAAVSCCNTMFGTSMTVSDTDATEIIAILDAAIWKEGTGDCYNDCQINLGDQRYYYHSDCGTVNDTQNERSFVLEETQREKLNGILDQYIRLGTEEST